ncbi:MAG: hypothetical protein QM755_12690 [Luteolibacter sp.]
MSEKIAALLRHQMVKSRSVRRKNTRPPTTRMRFRRNHDESRSKGAANIAPGISVQFDKGSEMIAPALTAKAPVTAPTQMEEKKSIGLSTTWPQPPETLSRTSIGAD